MWGIYIIKAVIGFIILTLFYLIAHILDYAIIYWIFIYIQMFIAPFLTAIGYLFYLIRLALPYVFMYLLVCIFLNLPAYKNKNIIKLFKYNIKIKRIKSNKFFIFLYQYNYIFIFAINSFLLFIVCYSYVHNKYFYLLSIFLFYFFVWIIIKIKHWLLKDAVLKYKKINIIVNLILVFLAGTYLVMTLENLHISNSKLYGFENFWKLIDNKYFIKMPLKDANWNRVFQWSRQISMDRYMFELKQSLIHPPVAQLVNSTINDPNLQFLYSKDKARTFNNINDDINVNSNSTIFEKLQNKDYKLGSFTNLLYKKFKKIFLIQVNMKPSNFLPTSEMNHRHRLLNWVKNPINKIDLSKYYLSDEVVENPLYENYLDLIDKRADINNLITRKVFLINLYKKNINLKDLLFYGDYTSSFKEQYSIFLKYKKIEEFNSIEFIDLESKPVWKELKNEIYAALLENEMILDKMDVLLKRFKNLYNFKSLKFSFRDDVLLDSDLEIQLKGKKNYFKMSNFKKLKIWRSFKLPYKEILYRYAFDNNNEMSLKKPYKVVDRMSEFEFQFQLEKKKVSSTNQSNELFFVFDNEVAYSLIDNIKLDQVSDLLFSLPLDSADEYFELTEFVRQSIKKQDLDIDSFFNLKKKNKYITLWTNDFDKIISEFQNKKLHNPIFSSLYFEFMRLNSNDFYKYIIENSMISRYFLISFRAILPYDMWQAFVSNVLNLNIDSLIDSLKLGNVKDFSVYLNKGEYDSLLDNFSLASDILKKKYDYDLLKYQLIPELEDIAGSCYESFVKYNLLIEKKNLHEEHVDLIDWIYDMSFDAIVNLMDRVKVINSKENDFLFDMINLYLKEPRYSSIAELFDKHTAEVIPLPENLEKFKRKYTLLYKFLALNEQQQIFMLENESTKRSDVQYLKDIDEQDLLDFDNISNLKQFRYKITRDFYILKLLPNKLKHQFSRIHAILHDDIDIWEHADWHDEHFEWLGDIYQGDQYIFNFDLGVCAGLGDICLNHSIRPFDMDILDDFFEDKFYDKIFFCMDEYELVMTFDFTNLYEDVFLEFLTDNNPDYLTWGYRNYMVKYHEAMVKGHIKVLEKLSNDYEIKKWLLLLNDRHHELLLSIKDTFPAQHAVELRYVELDQTPIYDWSRNCFIEENIDLIKNENPDLLLKMMDRLDKELDAMNNRTDILNNKKDQYQMQVKTFLQSIDPVTKKLLQNNWNDYNYFSNKNHKEMNCWYKAKAQKK